jgi:hypothetical protein
MFQFCKVFNTCVDKLVEIAALIRLNALSSIVFTALHNFGATPPPLSAHQRKTKKTSLYATFFPAMDYFSTTSAGVPNES